MFSVECGKLDNEEPSYNTPRNCTRECGGRNVCNARSVLDRVTLDLRD
jgi:hypothetical protein